MTKPRKATGKSASASKAEAGTGQRKNVKRTDGALTAAGVDSELLSLESKFDDIERLRIAWKGHGADEFNDMEDIQGHLESAILKYKTSTLEGLRIKAKAAKEWYNLGNRTAEEIAELDCEIQWIASFVETIESLKV